VELLNLLAERLRDLHLVVGELVDSLRVQQVPPHELHHVVVADLRVIVSCDKIQGSSRIIVAVTY
jgi:UDP-2,3-diacylglucosamine pyrophosphatase LpxH